jgi:simple sugar transport system ATP-binding protein
MTPILELQNVTKLYGKAPAVQGVNFTLEKGEVHALLGENGAGKSTLTKIMAGVVQPTSGTMLLDGKGIQLRTPGEAVHTGIAMVFQETSLVQSMTVAQNLFLGNEKFFNRIRGVNIAAQQFMQSLSFDVDPTLMVSSLGAAKKQMVEIARAMLLEARVIVFDEPTATLTPEEKRHFFDLVGTLKEHGVSVIFISHALEEALEISDRITILRDGQHVMTDATSEFDRDRIIQAMVGRELTAELYGKRKSQARVAGQRILSVQNLRAGGVVNNNSLSVFKGQVTGIFGLVGSGRTETFKVVSGMIKRNFRNGGDVFLNGKAVRYRVPAPGVRDGIAYITEDRKIEGFFETMPH